MRIRIKIVLNSVTIKQLGISYSNIKFKYMKYNIGVQWVMGVQRNTGRPSTSMVHSKFFLGKTVDTF